MTSSNMSQAVEHILCEDSRCDQGQSVNMRLWMWSLDVLRLPGGTCEASTLNSTDPEQVISSMIHHDPTRMSGIVRASSPPKVTQICVYASLHQERYGWSLSCSQRFVARSQSKGASWAMLIHADLFEDVWSLYLWYHQENPFSWIMSNRNHTEIGRKR